jgi:hypothetical protein
MEIEREDRLPDRKLSAAPFYWQLPVNLQPPAKLMGWLALAAGR